MKDKKIISLGKSRTKEIIYQGNGLPFMESYKLNDKEHREDGPAVIYYGEDGQITEEYYGLNGLLHREDGPAVIWYNKDGKIEKEDYYLNGKRYPKQEFENYLLKRKLELI